MAAAAGPQAGATSDCGCEWQPAGAAGKCSCISIDRSRFLLCSWYILYAALVLPRAAMRAVLEADAAEASNQGCSRMFGCKRDCMRWDGRAQDKHLIILTCPMAEFSMQGPEQASSKQQFQQQASSVLAVPDHSPEDDSGSCSDSACSQASDHSSSKGPKPSSRTTSPSRQPCAAAAGVDAQPMSCSAAAAAAPYARGTPGIRVPFEGAHWGGVRSVVAVAVLVSMGLISLLPGSATRGLVPINLSTASSAAAQGQQDSSVSARAMQAGLQQQQGSSIHLQTPLLLDSRGAVKSGGDSSSSSGSSSGSEERSSKSWARQRRVGGEDVQHDWSFIVGTGLGYVASILYLCSRLSQIHKNYSRKSSEGLALVMFIMAVCANLCTGTGIILRTFTLEELKEQLPWIIGSLGTISLDMVILWQSTVYNKNALLLQQGVGSSGDGAAVHSTRHHHHHHQHRDGVERQALLQSGQQHTAVDMPGGTAGPSRGQGAAAGVSGGAAVLDGMPLAPHHRGALIGRRHAAAAAAGDLAGDGAEVVMPLVGSSSHL